MKFALIHLTGPHRGTTQYFDHATLSLGSASDNDLVFPEEGASSMVPQRVELSQKDCEIYLKNLDPGISTLVNHNLLVEATLQDNDLIQLGPEGPKLRFRIRPEEYAACKRGPEIWRDVLDVSAEAKKAGQGRVRPFVGQLAHEVRRHASRGTQMVIGILLCILFSGLGGLAYYSYTAQQDYQRQLTVLHKELESARLNQKVLEQRTTEERQRMRKALNTRQEEFNNLAALLQEQNEQKNNASAEEVQSLERRLKDLEAELTNAEVLIKQYGPSICFLYIAYGLFVKGEPKANPEIPLEYMGTGFLVDSHGHIVTNRHIVEPWLINPRASQLVETGVEPRLLTLLAYFPNNPQPYTVSVVRVSDEGDVAIGKISAVPEGISPIPVHQLARPGVTGEAVVVVGYPVGVEALLARMDNETVDSILTKPGLDLKGLIQDIADRRAIRPLATQGHIGDVVPNRIIHDAPTTGGASGSPVFNHHGDVIAVNASVMTRFGGANAGVPIRLALVLLPEESNGDSNAE